MNTYTRLLLLILAFALTGPLQAQKSTKQYIKKYEDIAVQKMQEHGIPASIILGVSIVESAAGQSQICKALNNFFGVKGKNTSSQKKMGYKSAYREYKSDEESFEHFCQILKKKKFFPKMQGSADYSRWLTEMNSAAYASAKQKWIDDITKTIKKYELFKLDKPDDLAKTATNKKAAR